MIVLDTHALVWWVNGDDQLSEVARSAIERAATQDRLLVSSISAWEIALLVKRGRLELGLALSEWFARCKALEFVEFVPVNVDVALRSVALHEHHRDPADRFILATALHHGVPLVSRDRRFVDYGGVEVLW